MSSVISLCPFQVGQAFEFLYPADNRLKVSTRLQRRTFAILTVRDLESDPIEDWALRMRPDLRRSRFLLLGHDLTKHDWRYFYVGSIRKPQIVTEPLFRFALYDPVLPLAQPEFFGSVFTDTQRHSPLLLELVAKWNRRLAKSSDVRALGVFPWK